MSQRLQSILFFLSALLFALLFFLPLAEFDAEQINLFFYVFGLESKTPDGVIPFSKMFSVPVLVLAITVMLLAGYLAMSLFRAVKLSQFIKLHRIARISIIVNVVWIAMVFAFYIPMTQKALVGLNGVFYKPGVFMPVVALVLLIAAALGLRKDIKKVRSTDRIR